MVTWSQRRKRAQAEETKRYRFLCIWEFLVVDRKVETIKVFDNGEEFIYKFNPEVCDSVTCY